MSLTVCRSFSTSLTRLARARLAPARKDGGRCASPLGGALWRGIDHLRRPRVRPRAFLFSRAFRQALCFVRRALSGAERSQLPFDSSDQETARRAAVARGLSTESEDSGLWTVDCRSAAGEPWGLAVQRVAQFRLPIPLKECGATTLGTSLLSHAGGVGMDLARASAATSATRQRQSATGHGAGLTLCPRACPCASSSRRAGLGRTMMCAKIAR